MTQTDTDLFKSKAKDWDKGEFRRKLSSEIGNAIVKHTEFTSDMKVLDFGAGTGLICSQIAPKVKEVTAVDISQTMLDQLKAKPELQGKVSTLCQDILNEPLEGHFDLIMSAMALHHVKDTRHLLSVFSSLSVSGTQLALADLDSEEGDFHPPNTEGVFHSGFDREALKTEIEAVGFEKVSFDTALEINKAGKNYSVFMVRAVKK